MSFIVLYALRMDDFHCMKCFDTGIEINSGDPSVGISAGEERECECMRLGSCFSFPEASTVLDQALEDG